MYNIKMYIPVKIFANFYTLTIDHSFNIDQVGIALKMEFLIRKNELPFSVSAKKHFFRFYGLELNTNILGMDFHAEMATSHGSNAKKNVVK